ncbi:hypothetical protein, partial [Bacteroides salyersiae]|uniref:hypothetical protein n=1 Tax=Bacteroides salyersiae TaxID=291644 RepID=UPI0032C16BA7
RTEKLSPVTPMVLRNSGRVGSRRFFSEGSPCNPEYGGKGIFAFILYVSQIFLSLRHQLLLI